MPTLPDALRYVAVETTSEAELRRACAILELADDGDAATLRARLQRHLSGLDSSRPVICLHPGPVKPAASRGPQIPRPAADEYAPVFAAEIALVPDAPDFAAMLEQQLDLTRSLAITFGEAHAGLTYAPEKWTVREMIGHLADCERVLGYRLLRVLRGDATPVPGFDPVAYVTAGVFEGRALQEVIGELAAVRAPTLSLIRFAPEESFAARIPVGRGSITGRGLAYLIAGHERHHQRLLRTRYLPCMPAVADPGVPTSPTPRPA